MLKHARRYLLNQLWQHYQRHNAQAHIVESGLKQKGLNCYLDHFAVIDLPGVHSGIPILTQLFSLLGFRIRGQDYLSEKQNDFAWLAEEDSTLQVATSVLPQVVVADFRLDQLPVEIKNIVEKYARQTNPFPFQSLTKAIEALEKGDNQALTHLSELILGYLQGRDWPLPTIAEYQEVKAFNDLLAWVLVFGRFPNHFTFSIHLLKEYFANLEHFIDFCQNELHLNLNSEDGLIKGGAQNGIAQCATLSEIKPIHLADGVAEIGQSFVEFVWRYPQTEDKGSSALWGDYFTGFVPQQANRIIESLYVGG